MLIPCTSYPSVMHYRDGTNPELGQADFPIGYPEYYTHPAEIQHRFSVWKRYQSGLGFIKAHVFVPEQKIPPLPVKKGRLAFMSGHLIGTWTYHELNYAVNHCGVEILEFIEMIHFPRTHKVFHNFIEVFSKIKSEAKESGNGALEQLSKLLQNTGYGWTGMRDDDKTELKDYDKLEKFKDRLLNYDEELGYIEIVADVKSYTIQVQVAAYVTSYARLVLLDALRKQSAKGKVYYCDTDSLVCDTELDPAMVHKSALGMWDEEHRLYEGIFVLPKIYAIRAVPTKKHPTGEIVKFKGVTKATQKELGIDFYRDLLERYRTGNIGDITVEQGREFLRSLTYTQKHGIDPNTIEVRSKALHMGNRMKRVFDFMENKSSPWHMNTLEEFESFTFKEDLSRHLKSNGALCSTV